ncbi:helix-turn-helix domain-containing protein [Staphylococcus pseudoxylosus]|uniref:helix-turn-helix domain-containing protein n=1 Tax=Staphylococcus pseudoxylosus TaxID=2282419 RepID=UPI002DB8F68D|nr:helix-turn-helix transcriptional regulator [Staphylococcus pseudoxylosus]MEB8088220.1 helix-turn-helix domain-containing protein [Staphylococcus pseudoxylosus]
MRYEKLKTIMKEKRVTSTSLANELNIDRSTLYRKINMKDELDFTCSEMRKICLYLNISSDDFFLDL